eukprot:3932-Heterococcus_DN1.PRE.2
MMLLQSVHLMLRASAPVSLVACCLPQHSWGLAMCHCNSDKRQMRCAQQCELIATDNARAATSTAVVSSRITLASVGWHQMCGLQHHSKNPSTRTDNMLRY